MSNINADTPWAANQRAKLAGLTADQKAEVVKRGVQPADDKVEVVTKKRKKKAKKKTG